VNKSNNFTFEQAHRAVQNLEYCYGNYLLVKEAGKHVPQMEWKPNSFVGMSKWYDMDAAERMNQTYRWGLDSHIMFRYPLGDPIESQPWSTYSVQGTNIYKRRFANGIVLVNPMAADYGLEDRVNTSRDVVFLETPMIDAATGLVVNQIEVRGGTAKFLLSSPALPGSLASIANYALQWIPYFRSLPGVDDYNRKTKPSVDVQRQSRSRPPGVDVLTPALRGSSGFQSLPIATDAM